MMRSVLLGTVLFAVGLLLCACGKSMNDAERSYADACVKMRGGSATYKERCDCEAGIVASKLTPGELKAYVATQDVQGKPLTRESAAERGFTFEEFSSLGAKLQAAQGDISKNCAGK
ncbi:MAG TPA: hypothetical protein VJT74_04525 [Pyrinomonadaceae bacterium]|nr:hypothetical protein [Pyrinomonadaceae bacterium]